MNFKDYIRAGNSASDIAPLLADAEAFHSLIDSLTELFSQYSFDKVVGIEARGFVLAGGLAYKQHKGLVMVRKAGKLQNEVMTEKYIDYTKQEKMLDLQKDAIKKGEKVIIIDDWVETGGVLKATITLVEKLGGIVVGIGVLMDDSNDELKEFLASYNYKFLEKVAPTDIF